jgi:hypothetical protein
MINESLQKPSADALKPSVIVAEQSGIQERRREFNRERNYKEHNRVNTKDVINGKERVNWRKIEMKKFKIFQKLQKKF